MKIDKLKAKQLGVRIHEITQTMQAYFGSVQVSDFNRFGKYYRVVAQAEVAERTDVSKINGVFVKNNKGEMVPIVH